MGLTDEDFITALRRIDSATISDAVEKLKVRPRTEGYTDVRLKCLIAQKEPMVGFAITIRVDSTTPGRPYSAAGTAELRSALLSARKPAVAVFVEAGPAPERGCHMGDMYGTMLARNGVVGLVSGSGIRDLQGLRPLGLSAFALGTVVGHGVWTIVEVGCDVEVAGLSISHGDLLHGDGDGLVKVPADAREQLLAYVDAILEREEARKRIADEGWRSWELPGQPAGHGS